MSTSGQSSHSRGRSIMAALLTLSCVGAVLGADHVSVVTFDNGYEGWMAPYNPGGGGVPMGGVPQPGLIIPSGGNPGSYLLGINNDAYAMEFWNNSNQAFIGDYTQFSDVTLSFDVRVDSHTFGSQHVDTEFVLELRNYDLSDGSNPWVSMWIVLDTLPSPMTDFETLSVNFDPNGPLSPEWRGFGSADPDYPYYYPTLPDGITPQDVFMNVQEISLHTHNWDNGYLASNFTVSVDNMSIFATTIPTPGTVSLAALGLAGLARRRRG